MQPERVSLTIHAKTASVAIHREPIAALSASSPTDLEQTPPFRLATTIILPQVSDRDPRCLLQAHATPAATSSTSNSSSRLTQVRPPRLRKAAMTRPALP